MKVEKGTSGLQSSYQDDFPEETKCSCGCIARIAFTAIEEDEQDTPVCRIHNNETDNFWPHDYIAVAVYFCTKCFSAVTLWNQA